jgi:hypothetical protein
MKGFIEVTLDSHKVSLNVLKIRSFYRNGRGPRIFMPIDANDPNPTFDAHESYEEVKTLISDAFR